VVEVVVKERMDPVLKKLLDDLPKEDPDKPMAVVFCTWCEPVHWIYPNKWVTLDFGKWDGPTMNIVDVPVYYIYKGISGRISLQPTYLPVVHRGDGFEVRTRITIP
jgi:hypothetical protein